MLLRGAGSVVFVMELISETPDVLLTSSDPRRTSPAAKLVSKIARARSTSSGATSMDPAPPAPADTHTSEMSSPARRGSTIAPLTVPAIPSVKTCTPRAAFASWATP